MNKQAYEHTVGLVLSKTAAPNLKPLQPAFNKAVRWLGRQARKLKHAFNPKYGERLRDINANRTARDQANKLISANLDRIKKAPRHLGANEPHVQGAADRLAKSVHQQIYDPGSSGFTRETLARTNDFRARELGKEIDIIRSGNPNLTKAQRVITNTPKVPQVRINRSAIHPAGGTSFNAYEPDYVLPPYLTGTTTPSEYMDRLLLLSNRAADARQRAQFRLRDLGRGKGRTLDGIRKAEETAHLWRP